MARIKTHGWVCENCDYWHKYRADAEECCPVFLYEEFRFICEDCAEELEYEDDPCGCEECACESCLGAEDEGD